MCPTLFVLGMVGYNQLRVLWEFTLAAYVVKLLSASGVAADPGRMPVPDGFVWWRWRPPLLVVPVARTNLLAKRTLTPTIRVLNEIHET